MRSQGPQRAGNVSVRLAQPASATTRIPIDEYLGHFHTDRRAPAVARRHSWEWAFNDQQVQRVISAQLAVSTHARAIPDTLEKVQALNVVALARMEKHPSEETRKCAAAARRVGGFPAYWASILYRSIRLGDGCVEVARSLGVSPVVVRQALHGLNQTAQRLAAGTLRLPAKKLLRTGRPGRRPCWSLQEAIKLREMGFSYREVGAKLGVPYRTIEDRFSREGLTNKLPMVRRPHPRMHIFNHREAMEMKRAGSTYRQIAERFGVDSHSVWWALKRSPLFKTVEENAEFKKARRR
jgi:DNA-binding CsgD family transcriptional regulator